MSSKKSSVVKHVKDEFKLQHTRTTTSVYTDGNNKRHTIQNKQVSTATQERSFSSKPQYLSLTNGSGPSTGYCVAGPSRDRSTFTQTSKTTYKGPGNERFTVQDRDFHSSIQKTSYNPGQKAIGGKSNYSNRGAGDVARYNGPRGYY